MEKDSSIVAEVKLVGYHEYTMVFSFRLNNAEEYGTITNYDSIVIDGQEMGCGKRACGFDTFATFFNSIDKTLSITAEIFPRKTPRPRTLHVRLFSYCSRPAG